MSLAPIVLLPQHIHRMKLESILAIIALLGSSIANAHPGHEASGLHLHAGTPAASNSVDLQIACAALVLGLAYQTYRQLKRR
jgi:hypothetical protein